MLNRVSVKLLKKKRDNAIEEYTRCIKIDPEYLFSYYNRGVSYYNRGILYEADLGDYNKALEDYGSPLF